jgi:cytochrome c5
MRAAAALFAAFVIAAPAAAQQHGGQHAGHQEGRQGITEQDIQRARAAHPEGAQVFDMVCAMCHSVLPPHKAAPPVSHASAYYLRKHVQLPAAVAAMVAYLKEPAADRSAMPAHAIERFGLMPAQAHLTDAQLRAVARYVLAVADTVHVSGNHQHQRP